VTYDVRILRAARKALADLPAEDYLRVIEPIEALAQQPRPNGCVKLTGSPYWRIRVGVYRVIYEIDDDGQVVVVTTIGHRRDVYR
jgi:mRNA interferase RelE/StbE